MSAKNINTLSMHRPFDLNHYFSEAKAVLWITEILLSAIFALRFLLLMESDLFAHSSLCHLEFFLSLNCGMTSIWFNDRRKVE